MHLLPLQTAARTTPHHNGNAQFILGTARVSAAPRHTPPLRNAAQDL